MKDNTDKVAKKRAVETLIKNWKIHLNNKRQQNKKEILEKILLGLVLKKSNILKNYFDRWRDINNKIKTNAAKKAVARFIKNRYKIANARTNWVDLANNYRLKNRNQNLF